MKLCDKFNELYKLEIFSVFKQKDNDIICMDWNDPFNNKLTYYVSYSRIGVIISLEEYSEQSHIFHKIYENDNFLDAYKIFTDKDYTYLLSSRINTAGGIKSFTIFEGIGKSVALLDDYILRDIKFSQKFYCTINGYNTSITDNEFTPMCVCEHEMVYAGTINGIDYMYCSYCNYFDYLENYDE